MMQKGVACCNALFKKGEEGEDGKKAT